MQVPVIVIISFLLMQQARTTTATRTTTEALVLNRCANWVKFADGNYYRCFVPQLNANGQRLTDSEVCGAHGAEHASAPDERSNEAIGILNLLATEYDSSCEEYHVADSTSANRCFRFKTEKADDLEIKGSSIFNCIANSVGHVCVRDSPATTEPARAITTTATTATEGPTTTESTTRTTTQQPATRTTTQQTTTTQQITTQSTTTTQQPTITTLPPTTTMQPPATTTQPPTTTTQPPTTTTQPPTTTTQHPTTTTQPPTTTTQNPTTATQQPTTVTTTMQPPTTTMQQRTTTAQQPTTTTQQPATTTQPQTTAVTIQPPTTTTQPTTTELSSTTLPTIPSTTANPVSTTVITPGATTAPAPTTINRARTEPLTTTAGSITTEQASTELLILTTPTLDEVLSSLGLEENETNAEELIQAINGQITENTTLSTPQLMGYTSALSSSSNNIESPAEMVSYIETSSRLLDSGLTGTKAEVATVARSLVVVMSNAFYAASQTQNTSSTKPSNKTEEEKTEEVEQLVKSTMLLADKVGKAVTQTLTKNDKPLRLKSEKFGLALVVSDLDVAGGIQLDTGFGIIELATNPGKGDLALQALGFSYNPYAYGKNAAETVVDVSPLKFNAIGSNETVNYKASAKFNKTITANSFNSSSITETEGILTQYKIEDLNSFMKISLVVPDDGRKYIVRCNLGSPPDTINKNIEMEVDQTEDVTVNQFNSSIIFNQNTGDLMIFLNSRVVNSIGFFYIRITAAQEISTRRRKRSAGSASYSSSAAVYAPRVWNETSKSWVVSDDVEIDPSSDNEQVVFKSNYMGSITSGVIVPPNTIDFDTVFDNIDEKIAENPAVLIVVCLITVIYLLLLIPVRMLDIRDYRQWEYLPILHNKPGDKFIYQISILTGSKSIKPFASPVFIVLYGSKGKTTSKHLSDGKRQLFQPGKLANLLVTCNEELDDITHVHVWIRAKNSEQKLHIQYIKISEPTTLTSYTFLINDWISPGVDQPDCYGHEIYAVDATEGKDFVSLWKTNLKSKMFDDHLWLSVAKRPQKSNFSRVQRLSMCMSTLFLTMVVNAMWFPTDSTEGKDSPAVTIGPFRLTYRAFSVSLMGSLIVIPPNLLIMFFFRRSRPYTKAVSQTVKNYQEHDKIQHEESLVVEDLESGSPDDANGANSPTLITSSSVKLISVDEYNKSNKRCPNTKQDIKQELKDLKRKNKKPLAIPWFGVMFGYILVGVCIFNGAWWCFLYSIQWGKEISSEWLTSLALSLFSSILVIQPLKVIIVAVIVSLFLEDSLSDPVDTKNLRTVSELFGEVKPEDSIEPPVRPQRIEVTDPVVSYTEQKLQRKLMAKLKGIFTHLVYLVLLVIIVGHNQDKSFFYQNDAVKKLFGIADIQLERSEAIYTNLKEDIFPLIYPQVDYNNETLSEYDQQFISNIMGYLMGPVRIKQYREQDDDECTIYARLNKGERDKFNMCQTLTETRDWNTNWNGTFSVGNFEDPAFIHDDIKGAKIRGVVGVYERSGYSLEVQRYNWFRLINYLEQHVWIDKQTRAVTVEFVINNMNVNTWTQIKLLYETPNYGGVFVSARIESFRPYPFNDIWDFVFLVITCIWALVLIYITIKEFIALYKLGWRTYLQDVWRWIEVLNIILAVISIGLFILRAFSVIESVEYMMNNKEAYTDFDNVMSMDRSYSMMMAFILFIAILQLLKPMDFNTQLVTIKLALTTTSHILLTYAFVFFILLICYSHTLYIAFGSQFVVFSDALRALYYLFGMLLGVVKYSDVIEEDSSILRFLFCFYMIVGNLVLLNLFISVLNEGLASMTNLEQHGFDLQLNQYVERKLSTWWGMISGAGKSKGHVKERRGGYWNRALEIYFTLYKDSDIPEHNPRKLERREKRLKIKADKVVCWLPAVDEEKLTDAEKERIPINTAERRETRVIRLAIRTILMDFFIAYYKRMDDSDCE